MTSPEPNPPKAPQSSPPTEVPPVSPAYSTPPPEGIPDADNNEEQSSNEAG
jgi:hypothetical protein